VSGPEVKDRRVKNGTPERLKFRTVEKEVRKILQLITADAAIRFLLAYPTYCR